MEGQVAESRIFPYEAASVFRKRPVGGHSRMLWNREMQSSVKYRVRSKVAGPFGYLPTAPECRMDLRAGVQERKRTERLVLRFAQTAH